MALEAWEEWERPDPLGLFLVSFRAGEGYVPLQVEKVGGQIWAWSFVISGPTCVSWPCPG